MSSGDAISAATVEFSNAEKHLTGSASTDVSGYYALPLLSPGVYVLRVEAATHQAQEVHDVEVTVAERLEMNFRLRPISDIWEAGQYHSLVLPGSNVVVTYYGPDMDESRSAEIENHLGDQGALQSSISYVVSPEEVDALPLEARDVYATLVLQPGVASGTSTGRGLGVSVDGQRPTASNFLLDGVDNNNALVTGPLNVVAPEAVQEYRISTGSFSPEFGNTSGYIANAITRAGGAAWHGLGYYYLQNTALNANDLERNVAGLPRAQDHLDETGFSIGGPLLKNRLFLGLSAEYLLSTSQTAPAQFRLPAPQFFSLFGLPTTNSLAWQLMQEFPAPAAPIDQATGTEVATIARPSDLNRLLVLPRLDYLIEGGRHRVIVRESVAKLDLPDFIWSPYKQFITPLDQKALGLAVAGTSMLTPSLTNEARFAFDSDLLDFQRRWPNMPSLVTFDPAGTRLWLPGSPAFYGFYNNTRDQEFQDNVMRVHGRHALKFGGSALTRQIHENVDPGDFMVFQNYFGFYTDQTQYFFAPSSRLNPAALDTSFDRYYRYTQFAGFVQDSFRVTRRLTLDYGIRYERFGAPVNTGVNKDLTVQLGPGSALPEQIANATLQMGQGNQSLYATDNRDFAPRAGFAYSLRDSGKTVLRGSWGVFFDRPFDNLWLSMEANSFVLGAYNAFGVNYLAPLNTILPELLASPSAQLNVPNLVLYQPGLRNGYVQHFFLGVQHELSNSVTLELNGIGALGRDLITTDVLNRASTPGAFGTPTENPNLPPIEYRSNQGTSQYTAFTATARYHSSRLAFQAAYTWSHSIDNQSDPLSGDFFDFAFTGGKNDLGQPLAGSLIEQLLEGNIPSPVAAFTQEGNSHADRANSDFDQRQNLVGYATYAVPALSRTSRVAPALRGWEVAAMGAIRSGFPYSVFVPEQSGGLFYNNRANLVGNPYVTTNVPGGVQLLNPAAFQIPADGTVGNTGRNEFRGPGLASADLSLSRSFALPWLGEAGRLALRADFFNVFNHANLNNPSNLLTSETLAQSTFGIATYGRQDSVTGFPSTTPLDETPRQIQLMLRVTF